MKKTVWVLSLLVMLLSQVFSPFAYAVTGEETVIEEPVVEEVIEEPEVVEETKDSENPVEETVIEIDQEQLSWDILSWDNEEILSGWTTQEENIEANLEETENAEVIIENNMVVEAIEKWFWWETEYNSEEVRGIKEHKNVKVEVYAEIWAFEETPTLVIEPLEPEKETEIKKVILDYNEDIENLAEEEIEQVAEEKITEVVAFDIKFLDKEGKEVQPREWMVKVEFNYTENETLQGTEEHEVKVYHLDDKDNVWNPIEEIKDMKIDEPEVTEEIKVENEELEEQKVEEWTWEQKLTVVWDKFSIYTIVQQVKEGWPQATTENQLANFEYWEISIARPESLSSTNYPIEWFTIMDRNLWAITTWAWNDPTGKSYWYHYQWWNNYGFPSSLNKVTPTTNGLVWNETYYNNSWYYTKDLINWLGFDDDVWSDWSHHPWVWWWENDSNYDKTKNAINKLYWDDGWDRKNRQWPCPKWWHVPSAWEWWMLIKYWADTKTDWQANASVAWSYWLFYLSSNQLQFLQYFMLPIAGYRSYSQGSIASNPWGFYRSSTPYSADSFRSRTLSLNTYEVLSSYTSRASVDSVRCFKNTYTPHNEGNEFTITYEYNGWSWSTAAINVVSWSVLEKPSDPVKVGYVFDWWYSWNVKIKFDNENPVITWDLTLTAKYLRTAKIAWDDDSRNTFNYGTIQIWDYIIMDRNLWAKEARDWVTFNGDNNMELDSYWYYYQWWNSYWFSSNTDSAWLNECLEEISGWYISNKWNSCTWYYWWWTDNKNTRNAARWQEYERKWPCPEGFHIPTYDERVSLFTTWQNLEDRGTNQTTIKRNFLRDIQLPPSWIYKLNSDENKLEFNNRWIYSYSWSSSAAGWNSSLYGLYFDIDNPYLNYLSKPFSLSYWLPIRCMKNYNTAIITFNPKWWIMDETMRYVTKNTTTTEPSVRRDYSSFLWWYKDNDELFDFSNEITSDLILTAKWKCKYNLNENDDKTACEADDSDFVINYDSNWWIFSWSDILIKEINYSFEWWTIKQESKLDMPIKTWYMFAWWYTKSWYNNVWWEEFDIETSIEQTAYAKWLAFENLVVKFWDDEYEIMDRNMWAEETAEWIYYSSSSHENDKKLWFYYQWWNNYWFNNNSIIKFDTNNKVDWQEYWPFNYYYSNIFKKITEQPYSRLNERNQDLWWWKDSKNPDTYRQWPCPNGYHIPQKIEWDRLYQSFLKRKESDEWNNFCSLNSQNDSECFAKKLKLPFAWSYKTINSSFRKWGYWEYRTVTDTSRWSYPNYIYDSSKIFFMSSTQITTSPYDYQIDWLSLRCFKNSNIELRVSKDNWDPDIVRYVRMFDPITSSYKPSEPVKNWYSFKWWYEEWKTEKFDFSYNTYITKPTLIKAKREENPNYTYNANWWAFDNWDIIKKIKYNLLVIWTWISHSDNITDEGSRLRPYCDWTEFEKFDVVTVTWAKKLSINFRSLWLVNPDYIAVWTWKLINQNIENNINNIAFWKLTASTPTPLDKILVSWDTITIWFKSNWLPYWNVYWYYSIIEWLEYFPDEDVTTPFRTWYVFSWRYETWATEPFDFTWTDVTKHRVLYAKWNPITFTVKFDINGWKWEISDILLTYWKEVILPTITREWYTFIWWQSYDGAIYNNTITWWLLHTADDWVTIVLTAQWLQNPPAAWWGKTIAPSVKEQEHNSAEEQKQEEKETVNQSEKELQVEQVPSSTQSSTQTTTRTTTSTTVDPLILSAYERAYEHNITTISSLDDANPDWKVTRGHLAKMVVNYATNVLWREIPEKIPSYCRWNDWKTDRESEEIKDYAVKSCALWLMWLDMDKFLPNMQVTRAQFGTIMSRLLWWKEYAWWTPYYRKHLNALKENGIMTQIDNPEKRVELRQWVWVMLMRSAQNK